MITLRETPWDDPVGAALRAAQRAEMTVRYGTPDSEPGPAPTAADITVFLVAFDAEEGDRDEAIGCGGLSPAGRPTRRGQAHVRRARAPRHRCRHGHPARARGERPRPRWERLVLETGDRQPDAIRFYEREGYTRIPNFGHYADSSYSLCYERRLR